MQLDDLRKENFQLNDKLNAFYQRGAKAMEESGSLENTNDEFSNTKLAGWFDGALKEHWIKLCDALGGSLKEIQYLTVLSDVMQSVFIQCAQTVEETEKHLLQIAKYASEDPDEVRHSIRVVRKPLGQKKSTRVYVVKDIASKVKTVDTVQCLLTQHNLPDATVDNIVRFINELADICWLMCISNPPLKLNFEVRGQKFESVSQRFVEFATSEKIEYTDGKPGVVHLVAWPSVEREDNSGYLKKGEVIVCT